MLRSEDKDDIIYAFNRLIQLPKPGWLIYMTKPGTWPGPVFQISFTSR